MGVHTNSKVTEIRERLIYLGSNTSGSVQCNIILKMSNVIIYRVYGPISAGQLFTFFITINRMIFCD